VDGASKKVSQCVIMTVPDSIPALLAEEYLIDPQAILPSFLEILFVDDVHRSIEKAIQFVYNTVLEKFARTIPADEAEAEDDLSSRIRRRTTMEWCRRILQAIGTKWGIEIQSLIRLGIERTCLQWYDATIAETMYRMRRNVVVLSPQSSNKYQLLSPLKNSDRNKLAFLLALNSYLRQRFQPNNTQNEISMMTTTTNNNETATITSRSRILHFFRRNKISSALLLFSLWDAWDVYYHWKYLLGLTNYTHVINRLLGHVVRRMTQQDLETTTINGASSSSSTQTRPSSPNHRSFATWAGAATILMVSISWGTQLRAWYEERARQQRRQSIPPATTEDDVATMILPPPVSKKLLLAATNPHNHQRHHRGCGVCGRSVRIHPTTCRPTGLVFCKSCIYKHVRKHGQCPVTGIPLSEKIDLIGLYEPTEHQDDNTGT
jgi:hypothetical protein